MGAWNASFSRLISMIIQLFLIFHPQITYITNDGIFNQSESKVSSKVRFEIENL